MQTPWKGRLPWPEALLSLLLLAPGGMAVAEDRAAPPEVWQVRVGDDPAWALPPFLEPSAEEGDWRQLPLLADWKAQGLSGVEGVVWLRATVPLDEEQQRLASEGELGLALGPCRFGSYEVFAGGTRLGASPGRSRALPVPAATVFRIPAQAVGEGGGLPLALRLRRVGWAADRVQGASAVGEVFSLGSYPLLRSQLALGRSQALLTDLPLLILVALFAMAALYHLLLFQSRRQETPYLFFGLFALCFAINTLSISSWSRVITTRLDLVLRPGAAVGHLAAAVGIQFLWPLLGRRIQPWLRAYQLSQVAWALLVLLTPTRFLFATEVVRWLWLLPVLGASIVVLYQEARRGSEEARLIGLGGVFLVVCMLAQITVALFPDAPLHSFPLASIGFAGVLASLGLALSNRFRRVFDEREQLRLRLEEKVQERTAALARATERALDASRLKSEFLANISHEIRTPLNGVIGMTSLLAGTELSDNQKDYVDMVLTSGEALMTLINDVLDFSKIESGKLVIEQAPFDLTTVIEESMDLVATMAARKELELNYEVADEAPVLLAGDAARTRQILVNLLSNAVKFTHEGEVLVSLAGRPLPDGRLEIHLAVRDTGIGIPEDKMDSLFIPFHQLDGSTTRRYEGSGLGLVISKRLVDLLGGKIWVESRSDRGSTFHFTLVGEAVPELPGAVDPAAALAGKRLLLGVPHPTTRRLLAELGNRWGLKTEAVGSAEAFLTRLRHKHTPDAAVLDISAAGEHPLELALLAGREAEAVGAALLFIGSVVEVQELAPHLPRTTPLLAKPLKPSPVLEALSGVLAAEPVVIAADPGLPRFDASFAQRYPLRVLLAEDHLVNQKVTCLMLGRLGYRCDVAANGFEALQALTRQPYDVVLMDVQMPELDGLEATRKLRRYPPRGYRPYVVALTAHAMLGDRERCLAAGMDDYLEKPLRLEALKKALRRASRLLRDSGVVFGALTLPVEGSLEDLLPAGGIPEGGLSEGGLAELGRGAAAQGPQLPAEVLDLERLGVLRQLEEATGEALVTGLIHSYLERAEPELASLGELVRKEKRQDLEQAAHRLKGASSNLGVGRVAAVLQELEAAAPAASGRALAEIFLRLSEEITSARQALERQLAPPLAEAPADAAPAPGLPGTDTG